MSKVVASSFVTGVTLILLYVSATFDAALRLSTMRSRTTGKSGKGPILWLLFVIFFMGNLERLLFWLKAQHKQQKVPLIFALELWDCRVYTLIFCCQLYFIRSIFCYSWLF